MTVALVSLSTTIARTANARDLWRASSDPEPGPAPAEMSEGASGFGLTFLALGGSATGDAGLSTSTGVDEPDPFRGAALRSSGTRPVGGFATELLVRLSDVRLGFGTTIAFGDGFTLSSNPLPAGFSARPASALLVDVHAFLGRQLRVGPIMPYADVVVGGSVFQTNVRLLHSASGFLGETRYDALRFSLGPRLGIAVPIRGPLFIDGGGRADFFGFVRFTGYVGLGLFVGR